MEEQSIEIILRLFDQIKESCNKSDREIEKLSLAIKELFNSSSAPSHDDIVRLINELQDCLDDHRQNTSEPIRDIEDSKDELSSISKKLSTLTKRVTTMITVVCVAFALMVISYMFVRDSITDTINNQMDIVKQEQMIDKKLSDKLEFLLRDIKVD